MSIRAANSILPARDTRYSLTLTYSLLLTHSYLLNLTYSLLLTHSYLLTLTYSLLLTHSYLLTHSLTHLLTHSLTHSLTLTHSFTHSLDGWKWNNASGTSSFTSSFLAVNPDSQQSTGTNESVDREKSRDINSQDIAVEMRLQAVLQLQGYCDNSSFYKFLSVLTSATKQDILQRLKIVSK